MDKKLYRADLTVLFVSCQDDPFLLQQEAKVFAKEEIFETSDTFGISEVKAIGDIPYDWVKAIPRGDEELTDGEGISCLEFILNKDKTIKIENRIYKLIEKEL